MVQISSPVRVLDWIEALLIDGSVPEPLAAIESSKAVTFL
jgi:hypothetical protein